MNVTRFLHLALTGPVAFAQSTDLLPQRMDEMVVTASPLDRTLFELAQPATLLTDQELREKRQSTLGETLNGQPGVSATSFGPGASRPIIRGLGEDRVRILQNGTSVLDVSNVSPDHAVASDPSGYRSVEVVRGPATLLYGPNAVGGVVNVIDDRIPQERAEGKWPTGHFGTHYGSADDAASVSGAVNWGAGPFAFHLDAFSRETDDIDIPGFARSEKLRAQDPQPDEARGTLPNSFTESDGAALGGSYIWDHGYVGLSYSGIDSLYGTVAEEDVTIDLRQRRWDLRGAFYQPSSWIREINYKFSHSDYDHTEFEGPDVGTRFLIDGYNARTEVLHEKIGRFEGAFGFETQANEFSALGAEAFLPAVDNRTHSVFAFEEIKLDPVSLQFGLRYDRQTNKTSALDLDFDAFSTSAGIVYQPVEDYALSLSLGYSQRPPTYVELLADGLHVATGTYEIGDPTLENEDSLSLDLSLRKNAGRVTGSVSAFYYRFDDFISLQPTGNDFIDGGESFPEFAYQSGGADFYGGEIETTFHLLEPATGGKDAKPAHERLDLILRADYVHAEDRDTGEALPRIPPFRTTLAFDYQRDRLGARLDGQWAANQDRHADYELPTDGYFLLNAGLSYDVEIGSLATTFYLKGVNLLDQDARQSTSFLKDVAPLAGRGLVVGLRSEF
jgi:iron complex outermembrane recepter protein